MISYNASYFDANLSYFVNFVFGGQYWARRRTRVSGKLPTGLSISARTAILSMLLCTRSDIRKRLI